MMLFMKLFVMSRLTQRCATFRICSIIFAYVIIDVHIMKHNLSHNQEIQIKHMSKQLLIIQLALFS